MYHYNSVIMRLYALKQLQCLYMHVGEHEINIITTPKLNNRITQYSMTNDPEKVWPGGIVHYAMDASLSKFMITYLSCSTCLVQVYSASHICNVHKLNKFTHVHTTIYMFLNIIHVSNSYLWYEPQLNW